MAISKFVLIGSSAGLATATAGGVVAYLNSGESIKDHIASKFGANFKFISLVSDAEEGIKDRYLKSNENKPKKNDVAITKDQIVGWCKEVEDVKFSGETEPTYLSVKGWCFVNTSTMKDQSIQKRKTAIEGKNGTEETWKTAWEKYNKEKANLAINDDSEGLGKATDKEKGGPALFNWCSKQNNRKMYELGAEDNYKRYEKWCFQGPK